MIEQRTPEWFAARCGRITASRVKDVLALSKRDGKPLQAREDYATELVLELLTGQSRQTPTPFAMQWGVDNEPLARSEYESQRGVLVEDGGFVVHPELDYISASPDGLTDTCGIEIKCPLNSGVHLATLEQGMPIEHYAQLQIGMACTGLQSWDFISFDPRMPTGLRLYVQTIKRDDKFITAALSVCESFFEQVTRRVEHFRSIAA
jgi:putative phage-type endonuclease